MDYNFYPKYKNGKLHPQSEKILRQIKLAAGKPLKEMTVKEVRDTFFNKNWLGETNKNVKIELHEIITEYGKIPLRVYIPKGSGTFPVLFFFHGGGFVACKAEDFDSLCSNISYGSSCIVVSVDYRLAPENKFPAAIQDMKEVLIRVSQNSLNLPLDLTRVAVAGDSAGGNLAVNAALFAVEENIFPVKLQVLICPWLNLAETENSTYQFFGEGLWLSKESILWYREHYLNNIDEAKLVTASPFYSDNLQNMPPALIINSEFDVLRNEGEDFAQKLKKASVPVQCTLYKGMLHDFITVPGLFDDARIAINEICSALNKAFEN